MARWMTFPQWRDGPAPRNAHALVRGTVELPEGPCELWVCAADHYRLWLDGAYAGQGPVPAWPGRERYDVYPLEGGRTVTVALHIYYQGLLNRVWNSGGGRFGVWASLRQGGREFAHCGTDWVCRRVDAYPGSVTGYDTQFLEDFDSRLWPEGWEQPEYGCGSWDRLVSALWGETPAGPRPIKPLWEGALSPAEVRPVPGGVLLDFGGEVVGGLALTAQGPAGSAVILRFGEELDENHRVRFDMRCSCRYEERWTLAGGVSILHQYDYKAFRYAEILHGADVSLPGYAAQVRHYPMDDSLCTLRCPAGELEDIFRICKNAVRWCSQEGYLDCASREKGQYLGDAVVTARSQVWLTGSTELLRKCIGDFIASGERSPLLMAVAPCSHAQQIADYSLLFPLLVLTDYEFTGDKGFLSSCYPAVKAMTEAFGQYRRADGLLENVWGLWNMVDWPEGMRDGYDFPLPQPGVDGAEMPSGCHNVVNALWYGANLMRERIEGLLGLPVEDRSRQIGAAFRGAFYRPDERLFADSEDSAHCSLHANLYPAFFGLLPKEAEDAYEALLLTPGRYCGVLPMYFALRGLGRLGRYDTLYRLLTREDDHGWRNMLAEGATACFEAWGKDQKWNTSLCHPWASGPIPLVIEELAGVKPDPAVPGGFRFDPHIPDAIPGFALQVPWRGKLLQITKRPGEDPRLERTDRHAVSETE